MNKYIIGFLKTIQLIIALLISTFAIISNYNESPVVITFCALPFLIVVFVMTIKFTN